MFDLITSQFEKKAGWQTFDGGSHGTETQQSISVCTVLVLWFCPMMLRGVSVQLHLVAVHTLAMQTMKADGWIFLSALCFICVSSNGKSYCIRHGKHYL